MSLDWLVEMLAGTPPKKRAPLDLDNLPARDGDHQAYVSAAVRGELEQLGRTGEGGRNHQLNKAAFVLNQFVGSGELDANEVEQQLTAVAKTIGLDDHEIQATLASARTGRDSPRIVPPREEITPLAAFNADPIPGKPATVSLRLLKDLGLAQDLDEDEGEPEVETDGPAHADLSWVARGERREPTKPSLGSRFDGVPILYRGKINGIYGDPETAKTWLAMHLATQVFTQGGSVALIDIDHNGEFDTVDRFLKLGADPSVLGDPDRFRYYDPESPPELRIVRDQVVEFVPDFLILDSIGELIPMLGMDSNSNDDISLAYRTLLMPMVAERTAVLTIDHLPKTTNGNTGYAIGGIAKKRIVNGVYLHASAIAIPAPGLMGKIALKVTKDRPGGVRAHAVSGNLGVFRLDSTASDGSIVAFIDEGGFDPSRPVEAMEAISTTLWNTPEKKMSKTKLRENKGAGHSIRLNIAAVGALVKEGYIREATDEGSARTYYYAIKQYTVAGDIAPLSDWEIDQ